MLIEKLLISWTFTFILTYGFDNLSANMPTNQYRQTYTCLLCGAGKAVDGNMSTCMRTDDIGITTAYDSITWWYVDLGEIYNVYNIRILFKDYPGETMRQRGRFAGFSLYVSNTTDRKSGYLCYKNGPELPPLDFNTNCTAHGRYVIFYNERLNKLNYPSAYQLTSVFTELCDVTVTGCVNLGVYGNNCDIQCPGSCPENRCHIANGACFHCAAGWVGSFCNTECPSGTYGGGCAQNCTGHCINDVTCNRYTGRCDQGCKPGYIGKLCEKECDKGKYGLGCIHNCSSHCLNDVTCNKTTGICDHGCEVGYSGMLCETANLQLDGLNDNCKESSYIAGLSFLVVTAAILVTTILVFIRRYYKLVEEMRSMQYSAITRITPQLETDAKEGHQYQELRIEENSYHNLTLRN